MWQALPAYTLPIWWHLPAFKLPAYTLYVWWHLPGLNKLAETIMAQDSIKSLQLGHKYCGQPLPKEPFECSDSYRFLNDDAITHYRKQAHSGTTFIETYLAEHNIPKALYDDLRQQMEALDIIIFYKNTEKQTIEFIKPEQYAVDERIAYSPKSFFYYPANVRLIAPNWYVALLH